MKKEFDIDELKSYIEFRREVSRRQEGKASRHEHEEGVAFYAGHFYAYVDVLAQIELMEEKNE